MKKIKAWLSLIRLPNLFTVPGDAIFGYLIVNGDISSTAFICVIASVILFYIFGLITNDISDLKVDLEERPARPLPSGIIGIQIAKFAAGIVLVAALFLAYEAGMSVFKAGIILAVIILLYNYVFKNVFVIGPLLLVSCRIIGLFMGILAAHSIMISSYILFSYILVFPVIIFGISLAAQSETDVKIAKVVSGFALIACASVFWLINSSLITYFEIIRLVGDIPPSTLTGFIFGLVIMIISIVNLSRAIAGGGKTNVPPLIGSSIRNLILLQASACAFAGFYHESFAVVALMIPAFFLSKLFYQS